MIQSWKSTVSRSLSIITAFSILIKQFWRYDDHDDDDDILQIKKFAVIKISVLVTVSTLVGGWRWHEMIIIQKLCSQRIDPTFYMVLWFQKNNVHFT